MLAGWFIGRIFAVASIHWRRLGYIKIQTTICVLCLAKGISLSCVLLYLRYNGIQPIHVGHGLVATTYLVVTGLGI